MKHKRMEQILIISRDDKNWTVQERNEIVERALIIYLEKKRNTILNIVYKLTIIKHPETKD